MNETLKHQRTTLTGTDAGLVVDVVYANAPTAEQATEYVIIRLPLRRQQFPKLAEARLEALLRVRDLADNESREIRSAEGRGNELAR
jgi:hypothetical protein